MTTLSSSGPRISPSQRPSGQHYEHERGVLSSFSEADWRRKLLQASSLGDQDKVRGIGPTAAPSNPALSAANETDLVARIATSTYLNLYAAANAGNSSYNIETADANLQSHLLLSDRTDQEDFDLAVADENCAEHGRGVPPAETTIKEEAARANNFYNDPFSVGPRGDGISQVERDPALVDPSWSSPAVSSSLVQPASNVFTFAGEPRDGDKNGATRGLNSKVEAEKDNEGLVQKQVEPENALKEKPSTTSTGFRWTDFFMMRRAASPPAEKELQQAADGNKAEEGQTSTRTNPEFLPPTTGTNNAKTSDAGTTLRNGAEHQNPNPLENFRWTDFFLNNGNMTTAPNGLPEQNHRQQLEQEIMDTSSLELDVDGLDLSRDAAAVRPTPLDASGAIGDRRNGAGSTNGAPLPPGKLQPRNSPFWDRRSEFRFTNFFQQQDQGPYDMQTRAGRDQSAGGQGSPPSPTSTGNQRAAHQVHQIAIAHARRSTRSADRFFSPVDDQNRVAVAHTRRNMLEQDLAFYDRQKVLLEQTFLPPEADVEPFGKMNKYNALDENTTNAKASADVDPLHLLLPEPPGLDFPVLQAREMILEGPRRASSRSRRLAAHRPRRLPTIQPDFHLARNRTRALGPTGTTLLSSRGPTVDLERGPSGFSRASDDQGTNGKPNSTALDQLFEARSNATSRWSRRSGRGQDANPRRAGLQEEVEQMHQQAGRGHDYGGGSSGGTATMARREEKKKSRNGGRPGAKSGTIDAAATYTNPRVTFESDKNLLLPEPARMNEADAPPAPSQQAAIAQHGRQSSLRQPTIVEIYVDTGEDGAKDVYLGPVDAWGSPSGPNGILRMADGSVYSGDFENGQPHGQGDYEGEHCCYSGEMQCGKFHGFGRIQYKLQVVQQATLGSNGGYRDDQSIVVNYPKNTTSVLAGYVYEGEFEDDLEHGQGRYYFENGDVYTGWFRYGTPVGDGIYSHADRSLMRGNQLGGPRAANMGPVFFSGSA
ncbi:unnamed protein product [Amoebophrya sp. A120]|nr:unnamed protein product [Amoebophrya sp. A120]|eukprot:GSA120T00017063001.1